MLNDGFSALVGFSTMPWSMFDHGLGDSKLYAYDSLAGKRTQIGLPTAPSVVFFGILVGFEGIYDRERKVEAHLGDIG